MKREYGAVVEDASTVEVEDFVDVVVKAGIEVVAAVDAVGVVVKTVEDDGQWDVVVKQMDWVAELEMEHLTQEAVGNS